MSLVYAYIVEETGGHRLPHRLSSNASGSKGLRSAGVAFIGAEPASSGSIPVHEFRRTRYGSGGESQNEYAYSTKTELGADWARGSVAFHAWEGIGEGRVEMTMVESPIDGGRVATLVRASWPQSTRAPVRQMDAGAFWIQDVDYANWMYKHPELHGKKLRNICLPTTHDSGTSTLQPIVTDDAASEGLANLANFAKRLGDMIAATGVGLLIDIPKWVTDNIVTVAMGLARATKSDITTQLNMGVRGFDFRVFYYEPADDFFVAHGVLGIRYSDVLDQLADFLGNAPGEIVFASFSHLQHMDDETIKARFTAMLRAKLESFAYWRAGDASNNPLEQTYDAIITQGGTPPKSRIIIQYEGSGHSEFWSESQLGVVTKWTDTTDPATQWADQKTTFNQAIAAGKPFELSLSLTPTTADAENRLFAGIAPSLAATGALALAIPLYGWLVGPAVEALAASLAIYGETLDWWTLEDLSDKMSDNMIQTIRDQFVPDATKPNPLSRISLDFYEKTQIVNFAIEVSGRPAT